MFFAVSNRNKGFQWNSYPFLTPPQNEQKHTFKTLKSKFLYEVKLHTMANLNGAGMIVCRMRKQALDHLSMYSSGNRGC